MKSISYSSFISLFLFVIATYLFSSCDTFPGDPNCIDANTPCEGFSFAIVDDSLNNLVGRDRLINPDSTILLNLDLDTMTLTSSLLIDSFDEIPQDSIWWRFGMSPYQELNCFNQCIIDSAFSRFYYLYIGNNDWDTIEVHFPAKTERATVMEVYYNKAEGFVPENENIPALTSFWFKKKL
jgi:hypothetical protein